MSASSLQSLPPHHKHGELSRIEGYTRALPVHRRLLGSAPTDDTLLGISQSRLMQHVEGIEDTKADTSLHLAPAVPHQLALILGSAVCS